MLYKTAWLEVNIISDEANEIAVKCPIPKQNFEQVFSAWILYKNFIAISKYSLEPLKQRIEKIIYQLQVINHLI